MNYYIIVYFAVAFIEAALLIELPIVLSTAFVDLQLSLGNDIAPVHHETSDFLLMLHVNILDPFQ